MPKKRVSQAKRKNSAANGVKENGIKSKTNGTVQTNGGKPTSIHPSIPGNDLFGIIA